MVTTTISAGSTEHLRAEVIGEGIEEKVEIVLKVKNRFMIRNKIVEVQARIQALSPALQTSSKLVEKNKSSPKK